MSMDLRVGFIGGGAMAEAIVAGITQGTVSRESIYVSDHKAARCQQLAEQYGIHASVGADSFLGHVDVLFLAVKPQFYEDVILSIRDHVKKDALIVTLAPGKTLEWLGSLFGEDRKIIRTMPNTPAMVGEGMTAVCPNHSVTDEELDTVLTLLSSFGQAEVIPENLIDVATAVSGSSPAYIFLAIEAMADGAVADGMPRNKAYRFAAQAVLGSAKMVLETGKHPGELKDMVCSPGGTTMEAVRVLEEKGLRSALIEAEKACVRKARAM